MLNQKYNNNFYFQFKNKSIGKTNNHTKLEANFPL